MSGPVKVAVLLPCYNEELTIGRTIAGFRQALPDAEIWVCDNNSKDRTAEVARAAGAIVVTEYIQGKGAAVRRLFAEAEADVYIMADGDETYDPNVAPNLVQLMLSERLDMIIGGRLKTDATKAFRRGHMFGNLLFSKMVSRMFRTKIADLFSGYRFMSRRFVKTFPANSQGFEIESELTIHLVDNNLPYREVETFYASRPEGSVSKLSSFRDGFRILRAIVDLFRHFKPLSFFGALSILFLVAALGLSVTLFAHYFTTGLVPNLPTAVLVTGLGVVAFVLMICGLILDAMRSFRRAQFRAQYLALSAKAADERAQREEESSLAMIEKREPVFRRKGQGLDA